MQGGESQKTMHKEHTGESPKKQYMRDIQGNPQNTIHKEHAGDPPQKIHKEHAGESPKEQHMYLPIKHLMIALPCFKASARCDGSNTSHSIASIFLRSSCKEVHRILISNRN